jgi:F420-0:gamma-glutamyl ligase
VRESKAGHRSCQKAAPVYPRARGGENGVKGMTVWPAAAAGSIADLIDHLKALVGPQVAVIAADVADSTTAAVITGAAGAAGSGKT